MRLGCCVAPDLVQAAADAGYDFVELPAHVLLPERPDDEYARVRDALSGARVRPEVWDLALPEHVKVCGPEVDWPRVSRFVNTALRRAAELGGSVAVFTCGKASQIPAGFLRRDALGQVCDFLRVCCAVARRQGLILGIEPAAADSAALVTSLPQAMALVSEVHLPEVGVLPSLGRMAAAGQSAFDVVDAAAWLAHVHVPADQLQPDAPGDGAAGEFREALRLAGYEGRVSVQAAWSDPQRELPRALETLRRWCRTT
jgi:sugar phosphate isomerase/epimerase